jgi:PII-like signaling protein
VPRGGGFRACPEAAMQGYQISFFTQQDRYHQHQPLAEWLLLTARELGVRGATIVSGSEGYGAHRRIHSAHFFELADQPLEVTMVVSEGEATRLFALLEKDGVHLFYVKIPVEFGVLGVPDD